MKLFFKTKDLREACSALAGVVPSRSPKAELTCFSLAAKNGQITVRASDLDLFVDVKIPGIETENQGEILVPTKQLGEILRDAHHDKGLLEEDTQDGRVALRLGRDVFRLVCQTADNYPKFPEIDGNYARVRTSELERLIRQTCIAASTQLTKYALHGVLLHFEAGVLRAAATDGRRLAMSATKCEVADKFRHVVPTRTLEQVLKLLRGTDSEISIRANSNAISFEAGMWRVASRVIDGTFPEYSGIIPRSLARKIVFDREKLLFDLRRSTIFTNDQHWSVLFRFSSDSLELVSCLPDQGESNLVVDIQSEGEPFEIGFKPHFWIDGLKVIKDPKVTLEVESPMKPGVIRIGDSFVYVVMPMVGGGGESS